MSTPHLRWHLIAVAVALAACGGVDKEDGEDTPPASNNTSDGSATSDGSTTSDGSATGDTPLVTRASPISGGRDHTCLRTLEGQVWCWGNNGLGQLGDGSAQDSHIPVKALGLNDAVAVYAGGLSTCAIHADGGVSCWGWLAGFSSAPLRLEGLADVVEVAIADIYGAYACALHQGGAVSCWPAASDAPRAPERIAGVDDAVAIALGSDQMCALHQDGSVSCWGFNQLNTEEQGLGAATPVMGLGGDVVGLEASNTRACALHSDGGVSCWGEPEPNVAVRHVAVEGVSELRLGLSHACGRVEGGAVVCWGDNNVSQLGAGTRAQRSDAPVPVAGLEDAVALGGGESHTCALREGGGVVCWGSNGVVGALGAAPGVERHPAPMEVAGLEGVVQVVAGAHHSCARHEDGAVWCWGSNARGQLGDGAGGEAQAPMPNPATSRRTGTPTRVVGIDDALMLSAGPEHTCALREGGDVWCWGEHPGAGDPDPLPVAAPGLEDAVWLASGTHRTCVAHTDGAVTCTPTELRGAEDFAGVRSLNVGMGHLCAVDGDGAVACLGNSALGESGDPSGGAPRLAVVGLESPAALSGMWEHTCALDATRADGGAVLCWGSNDYGRLGDGTTEDHDTPAGLLTGAEAIAAGVGHTCALRAGTVACWGRNNRGQLGDGTTEDRASPLRQGAPVTVAGLEDVRAVAAGGSTCALHAGGRVSCWGDNDLGQLGNGVGPTPNTNGANPNPTPVLDLDDATQITVGGAHACALRQGGAVACWGYNSRGQLGDDTATNRNAPVAVAGMSDAVQVVAGVEHTCARHQSGDVSCWGVGNHGQVGPNATPVPSNGGFVGSRTPVPVPGVRSAVQVAVSGFYSCALLEEGTIACWGQLPDGSLDPLESPHALDPRLIVGIDDATAIMTGKEHMCALRQGGVVSCWGLNTRGALGLGTRSGDGLGLSSVTTPFQLAGLDGGVRATSGGYRHSCALFDSGAVACWGANSYGQLGNGEGQGPDLQGPADVYSDAPVSTGIEDAVHITAGGGFDLASFPPSGYAEGHSCAVHQDGAVSCWGYNGSGQLGHGTLEQSLRRIAPTRVEGLADAVSVSAGFQHTCAVRQGGRVSCWGDNAQRQAGQGADSSAELVEVELP